MSERFCSVIVLGPAAPRTLKVHLSRTAIAILAGAFLLAFVAAAVAGYRHPTRISEGRRAELEAENRTLRNEATNAVVGIQTLDSKVAELEANYRRVHEMVNR